MTSFIIAKANTASHPNSLYNVQYQSYGYSLMSRFSAKQSAADVQSCAITNPTDMRRRSELEINFFIRREL